MECSNRKEKVVDRYKVLYELYLKLLRPVTNVDCLNNILQELLFQICRGAQAPMLVNPFFAIVDKHTKGNKIKLD